MPDHQLVKLLCRDDVRVKHSSKKRLAQEMSAKAQSLRNSSNPEIQDGREGGSGLRSPLSKALVDLMAQAGLDGPPRPTNSRDCRRCRRSPALRAGCSQGCFCLFFNQPFASDGARPTCANWANYKRVGVDAHHDQRLSLNRAKTRILRNPHD